MIKSVEIKDWGPINELRVNDFSNINLIIGQNGSGKTFLLKALYCTIKAIEQTNRGREIKSSSDILSEKLYWTFQVNEIGDLVAKGKERRLTFRLTSEKGETAEYSFGSKSTTKLLSESTFEQREDNSIFIPAKEVLSLQKIIFESRDNRKEFGFDDTYYDLAKAIIPNKKGKDFDPADKYRKSLAKAINGRIEYDEKVQEWVYISGSKKTNIYATCEGVKKIAILDTLLSNNYLSPNSIVFIDEPESALHPELVSTLLDMVFELSRSGIQFFIASHSYFVIKKLYLLAHQKSIDIPVLSMEEDGVCVSNLREEMPENRIINESIRLYEEEVDLWEQPESNRKRKGNRVKTYRQ